jgi:glycosyltransferase involved in cell wall biosynthesis
MKILFLDFSTKLKTVDDLKTRARGGMVSSLLRVPDELTKLGHEVFVLSDIPEDTKTEVGTIWCAKDTGCHLKGYDWDHLILNRGIAEAYTGITAKHRILWTHDLPHAGFIPEPKMMHAFSGVVFMSRYAEHIWRTYYRTIGRSFYIPNGVDKDLFWPVEADRLLYREHEQLIFGSAPNRGARRLNYIFDCIKTRVPRAKLTAYTDMETMHPNESKAWDSADDWNDVKKTVSYDAKKPIPQTEWAKKLRKAGLMILPTRYPEICSNSILQSLASGTPVITTGNLGSACEWIKHGKNGMLTNFQVHDYMVHTVEMVRNAVTVLENPKLHKKMIKNATKTKIHSWKEIGKLWERMMKRL